MVEENLKPRVVVGGGFHKTGAIVEGDENIEYIAAAYVRLRMLPIMLRHVVGFDKERVFGDEVEVEELDDFQKKLRDDAQSELHDFQQHQLAKNVTRSERFIGESEISSSRWRKFELSLFGSDQLFSKLSVSIHRSTEDCAIISYMEGSNDLDGKNPPNFFCQINLNEDSFDEIVRLHINGNHKQLELEVDISGVPGFYAEWSPAIDEGRIVKFLDRTEDLENPEDLPSHFSRGRFESCPFRIWLNTIESNTALAEETSVDSAVEDLSYNDIGTEERSQRDS